MKFSFVLKIARGIRYVLSRKERLKYGTLLRIMYDGSGNEERLITGLA